MKIIIIDQNHTDHKSYTASVHKGNIATHAKTEVQALEQLLAKIKEKSNDWILEG